nr:uncharacterized protein LOC112292999 [Physcomitrium patens]|eukprot:XP_024397795.1 uncharacterized protein LOC112292999 [Physcomitrella patens]
MAKIHCLTSMFVRKTKMKNSTPAESVHSESVWELSQKQLLSKDGDHLSESSQKDLMAKDYSPCIMADPTIDNEKLLTVPVGNTSKKLLSVSSIAKKDNVLCWTELDLPPSVDASKASHAELFEFDTGALDKIKYERADSYDKHVASVAEAESFPLLPSVVDLEQRHDPCGCLAKFKGAYDEIWVGQKLSYPCPFVFLDAVSGQTPALPSCSPSNSFGFASRCGLLLPLQSRNLCLTALDVACRLRFVCTYLLVCLLGF